MPANQRRRDRARFSARNIAASIAAEVRHTRLGSGLSIATASTSVGLHQSTFGRIERNELREVSVEQLALACAAVGLQLSVRAYPADDPARDAGHLRLLTRFRARLPAGAAWYTEVPLPIAADPRALDGMLVLSNGRIGVEAETRLGDVQAIDRRVSLKKRDAQVDRMILLVADTRMNREILRQHREALRGSYPLDTKAVLAALAVGELPAADGLVVL